MKTKKLKYLGNKNIKLYSIFFGFFILFYFIFKKEFSKRNYRWKKVVFKGVVHNIDVLREPINRRRFIIFS